MKLLYVVHQFFPECYSGTEQYCLAAAREGRRRGDEVVVLSLTPDFGHDDAPLHVYEQPHDGFRVIRLRPWGGFHPNDVRRDYENPVIAARFRRVLREVAPQAVHFFHLRHLGSDLIEEARDAGVRTVVHLMDYWYLCPRFTLLRGDGVTLCQGPPDGGLGCIPCHYPQLSAWTEPAVREAALLAAPARTARSIYNSGASRVTALLQRKDVLLRRLARADAVIAPSRFLAAMFERNGFPAHRIAVVPYGLEPGRVTRADVRRPRSPLRAGYCGILSPWKAPHVAVDAVRRVAGPLRLTVHGRFEPMFAAYNQQLRERAGGDARIAFPGPYDQAGLSQVMAELDVLVVPSTWYENTPFVILEALEAGVPIIASNLGGMAELIEEGRNGFLFESGNADALAAVLRRCLAEPAVVARLEPRPAGSIADNYERFRAAYGAA